MLEKKTKQKPNKTKKTWLNVIRFYFCMNIVKLSSQETLTAQMFVKITPRRYQLLNDLHLRYNYIFRVDIFMPHPL